MRSRSAAAAGTLADHSLIEAQVRRYLGNARPEFALGAAGGGEEPPPWVRPVRRQVVVEYRGLHILIEPVVAGCRCGGR